MHLFVTLQSASSSAPAIIHCLNFSQVPLLAVSVKAINLGTHLTVLRLRDGDGNEMNGIVWNARVQDQLAEKLVPGILNAVVVVVIVIIAE